MVVARYKTLPLHSFVCNKEDILLSGRQRQIGPAENQREITAQLERSSEDPRTYVNHMYSDISPYIVAYRYHIGSGVSQAATVVVVSCGSLLPI
jgi:hypothetical protein